MTNALLEVVLGLGLGLGLRFRLRVMVYWDSTLEFVDMVRIMLGVTRLLDENGFDVESRKHYCLAVA